MPSIIFLHGCTECAWEVCHEAFQPSRVTRCCAISSSGRGLSSQPSSRGTQTSSPGWSAVPHILAHAGLPLLLRGGQVGVAVVALLVAVGVQRLQIQAAVLALGESTCGCTGTGSGGLKGTVVGVRWSASGGDVPPWASS